MPGKQIILLVDLCNEERYAEKKVLVAKGTTMEFVSDEGPECGYIIAKKLDDDESMPVMYGDFQYVDQQSEGEA